MPAAKAKTNNQEKNYLQKNEVPLQNFVSDLNKN